ncbi:Protein EFFECTOR OF TRANSCRIPTION 2 [Euphorbia peplus]|nr:Protein EFFECTOR OF TRANSCRIPTION 2 [Euphorbia peplus]
MAAGRFKREDHKRTKHDSHFSKWQVLIGPSDWEDYAQGKEGSARYRVHSLPSNSSPGLYELGVSISRSRSQTGRQLGKLDPDDIAVAYLGQADNVRSRLQRYGRCGAHLRNGSSPDQKGVALFDEVFSKGHSIVYRWASMRDKRTAENTEAQLLDTFDYAWNKGSNSARRPKDIIDKLSQIASSSRKFTRISKKLLFLRPGQVGIRIEASKPPLPEECPVDEKSFLHGIFKFSRWQPRLVAEQCSIDENSSNICGIITSEGIPCKQPPVQGRKRCKQHKGMRIYGLRSKPITDGNSHVAPDVNLNSKSSSVCGVNLGDGNLCKREPVSGRKRCSEHKGMRIKSSIVIKSISEGKQKPKHGNGLTLECGVGLEDGSVCSRTPVQGRKRCEEHKGIRVSKKTILFMG